MSIMIILNKFCDGKPENHLCYRKHGKCFKKKYYLTAQEKNLYCKTVF